jgi:uncharacterized protein
MKIKNKETGNEGAFFIDRDGEVLAEMTYSLPQEKIMIIDHTEVDDQLRGKNIGNDLVSSAVEYARAKHMKIIPQCSFARSVFERNKDFADVLTEG